MFRNKRVGLERTLAAVEAAIAEKQVEVEAESRELEQQVEEIQRQEQHKLGTWGDIVTDG